MTADVFYRGILQLVEELKKDGEINKICEASAKAPKPVTVTVCHNICKIDCEWLDAIERGLVFIGKAIEEDRQFIRSDGEVQPIEKVKKFSRESVQHLSRHSDLITRKQQSDEIVPEKLYTVERDSDYAVYENKFLYLLLTKIRDFVSVRYEAITLAYREYRGEYEAHKIISTAVRRLSYDITVRDEQDDVISAPADRECAAALDRIDKIMQSVSFYLHTPLMLEVSHADKLKGNITKTNVLQMNKNFHEALLLYEYLLSYEGDGYTIEKSYDTLDPVPDDVSRELALPPLLLAFLVYEHGLKLEEYLKGEFLKEEARREEEAQKALQKRLRELKKRVAESGKGAEEYMLALEERVSALEKNIPLLESARAENEELKSYILRLEEERKVLLKDIDDLKAEIERLIDEMKRVEEEHRLEIERINAEHEQKIAEITALHEQEIAALNAEHEQKISQIKAEAEQNIAEARDNFERELARAKAAQAEETAALNRAFSEKARALEERARQEYLRLKGELEQRLSEGESMLRQSLDEGKRRADELESVKIRLDETDREREVLQARLTAIRSEYGLLTAADDFTTEEGFNALEHEFEVLGKLVRDEWTDVKKILKKEFYSDIRDTMRKKKPKKTKEYEDLSSKVRARNKKADEQGGGSDAAQSETDEDIDD